MQRAFGECGSKQERRGGHRPRDSTALPPFSASPPLPSPHPELPSIKSQSGARWLRPTLTSPPPPPPSPTQPAGHWRQGPEVTQFYAAPWTSGLGGCQQDGWRRRGLMRGVRQVLGPLSPAHPHLSLELLEHQSAALVVSLIWLLLACRLPGSCCRAGSSVVAAPARPPVRPVVIPPPHTLRYAAVRGRGSQGA